MTWAVICHDCGASDVCDFFDRREDARAWIGHQMAEFHDHPSRTDLVFPWFEVVKAKELNR